jgi:prophage regulatory protein
MKALTLHRVVEKSGLGKSSIYKGAKEGTFPAPAHAGGRSIWDEAEVDAWLSARFAERDAQQVKA